MAVLVVAEHDSHEIKEATLNTVMAACHISMYLDGQIHLLLTGAQTARIWEESARISGVSKVIVACERAPDHHGNGAALKAQAIARAYSHMLFPANVAGKQAAQRLAAGLGVRLISDISGVVSPDVFRCANHEAHAPASIQNHDTVKVITVRTTAFEAALREGGIGHIEQVLALAARAPGHPEGAGIRRLEGPACTQAKMARPRTYAPGNVALPIGKIRHEECPFPRVLTGLFDGRRSAAGHPGFCLNI